MAEAGGPPRRIEYTSARRLVLLLGLLVLAIVAVVSYVRGVEPVEVAATILFIPVFLSFLFFRVPGGLAAGVLAAGAYLVMRWPAIRIVGFGLFARSFIARALAYPLFGLIGGWASAQLEASLNKLELYDQIDDATGLFNARFFVQDTELEMSRANRYQSIFSVALVDIPSDAFAPLGRRQRAGVLKDIGQVLKHSVRVVDRPVHAVDGDRHHLAIVLPETANSGAQIFTERLAGKLTEHLAKRGVAVERHRVTSAWVTFPDDPARLEQLRQEFSAIDRLEHPEEPANNSKPPATG
ncbi:MAG TPA: diguanylate cyclase [Actinomycetota bacterium]|jgi:diguanylate cyclase (GGDEF)-like protein